MIHVLRRRDDGESAQCHHDRVRYALAARLSDEPHARIRNDVRAKLVHRRVTCSDEQRVADIGSANAALILDGLSMRETSLDETSVEPELVACGDGEWSGGQFSS